MLNIFLILLQFSILVLIHNLSFEIPGFKVTTGQQADQVGKPSAAELIGERNTENITVIRSPESAFDYDVKRFNTYENPLEYLEQVEAGELSDAFWNNVLESGIIGSDLAVIRRDL